MNRKSCFLVIMILFPMLLMAPSMGLAHSIAPSQHRDGEWKGSVSNQKQPFIRIVATPAEWNDLWLRAFETPAPNIDFEKQVVACVFLGHSADWLYSIHIGEPFLKDGAWVVPYGLAEIVIELAGPFRAGGQFAMKVLEKKKDAPMAMELSVPPQKAR